MKHSIWKLFFITAIALSLAAAPAVNADEVILYDVTGYIKDAFTEDSKIEIVDGSGGDPLLIHGFPFNNLEAQLEVIFKEDGFTIKKDDCLSVKYYKKTMPATGETFDKWDSLTMYNNNSYQCEECNIVEQKYECDCTDIFCSDDEDGMKIEPFHSQHQLNPGHGQGKGQGHIKGKPPVTVPGHNKR